ncbi:MAG: hypothetical protein ACREMX_18290 [Gemmatimonadales bacterium]
MTKRSGPERQVRLKPESAHLYPGILAGVWTPAWQVAEQLSRRGQAGGTGAEGRVCDPAHFTFRGGQGRPPELRSQRTRSSDPKPRGSR